MGVGADDVFSDLERPRVKRRAGTDVADCTRAVEVRVKDEQ